MRLGKQLKLNVMIAILLCMVFVVNLGVTFASGNYRFVASSVNTITTVGENTTIDYDTYAEYASASSTSGKFIYSPGVYNNNLSINYGFSANYDLMIKFTATYANKGQLMTNGETHIANDFSLNFVNRDAWCVDMGSVNGWKVENGVTKPDSNQVYYTQTSTSNTIKGVMYYMGTKNGSGTLPVISGVTFHTSPNNSYKYIGDTLEITLEPVYVKSSTYSTTTHAFANVAVDGFVKNSTVFANWINYMNGTTATADNATIMIYNSYVDNVRSLSYPKDDTVITNEGIVNPSPTLVAPKYSNTAHRYDVGGSGRSYDAITAGNKYNGGVGVYVIPNTASATKAITVSITVSWSWQKYDEGSKTVTTMGQTDSEVVDLKYSSQDLTAKTDGSTNYYYYKSQISSPTYINVLESIMLTAENNVNIIKNGYYLVLNDINVTPIKTLGAIYGAPQSWPAQSKANYEVLNATASSPILVRVQDVITSSEKYETTIAVTNKSDKTIGISQFTISSKLWYATYTDADDGSLENFQPANMGDGYLPNDTVFTYDTSKWQAPVPSAGSFTFSRINGAITYIPSGYTLTLISGLEIPTTSACQTANEANDFWCELGATIVTNDSAISYTSSTAGVEIITQGYYDAIEKGESGYIYIRNNTDQVITNVAFASALNVKLLNPATDDYEGLLPRNRYGDDIQLGANDVINHLPTNVSIKPNEMVLAYTVTPNLSTGETAIIFDFSLNITLATGAENYDIDLVYNRAELSGLIINNSEAFYEFRLESVDEDLTDKLINPSRFEESSATIDGKTYYYYYYKGVICPHRQIEIFNSFANNVVITHYVHNANKGESNYVATNFATWNNTDSVGLNNWFNTMVGLYGTLTFEDLESLDVEVI